MTKTFCVCLIVGCLAILTRTTFAQEVAEPVANAPEKTPYVGEWKVVAEMSGTQFVAIPDNEMFLLTDMIAEYHRSWQPAPVPVPKMVLLHNTNWTGRDIVFKSCMYRCPSDSKRIERFSDKNVEAYCYLQLRGDSAILVISKTELKTDPFQLDNLIAKNAQPRLLILSRVDENAKTRGYHIRKLIGMVDEWFGGVEALEESEKRLIGGFIDEHLRNSNSTGDK